MLTLMLRTIVFLLLFFPVSTYAATPSLLERLEELRESTLTIKRLPFDMTGVPQGAMRVRILPLHFTASCDRDITISYIRIKHIGLGDANDIRRVYVLDGNGRLTRGQSFDSKQTATLRLQNFVIPACETEQLDIAVDFKRESAVGGRHYLQIMSTEDILTNADIVDAEFPLQTAKVTPSVTPSTQESVEILFLPIAGTISAVRSEMLAKFRVKAPSRHQLIYSVMLTNEGTAKNDDLRNIYLTRNRGRSLTRMVGKMDGNKVYLKFFRPFLLHNNSSATFRLMGNAYTTNKTIKFSLEEPSDIDIRTTRKSNRIEE